MTLSRCIPTCSSSLAIVVVTTLLCLAAIHAQESGDGIAAPHAEKRDSGIGEGGGGSGLLRLARQRESAPRRRTPFLQFNLQTMESLGIQNQPQTFRRNPTSSESIVNNASDWSVQSQNAGDSSSSTIPKNHPNNRRRLLLQEFHATRHLSRYERHHRASNHLDLQLHWNGTYASFFHPNHTSSPLPASRPARTRRRLLQDSVVGGVGGQFDNYQAVPLSQGYGTHFANVWVGSPVPQRKTVIVDTGSHYTAFPCAGCKNCGAPHHTDPYFNPQQSHSYRALHCDECRDGVLCSNGQCLFSQSYTEGSSWEAIQVMDKLYCGGTDILDSVEPMFQKYSIDFMFGCQQSMTGLFITQLADGIMGMSAHPATLPKQLFDKRIIEHNMFAMCFRRELGTSKRGVTAGSMTLGGFSTVLDTSPMVYAKNMASSGWFTVYVKNIYIRSGGGQSAAPSSPNYSHPHKTIRVRIDPGVLNSGKGVIVDSGTTDTYLNKAVAKEFSKAWKRVTGKAYSHAPIRLSNEELQKLPTILVQCHGYTQRPDPSMDDYSTTPGYAGLLDPQHPNDLIVAIPATSYMDYSAVTNMYTSRVYFTETAGGVLGSNAMQGHQVVFDWENGRIGFAESSCSYDKRNVPKAALDEGYSSDCIVGTPVVTQSCIETVDRRLCKHNPSNIALLGTETFTALVESPGTGSEGSCVESAKSAKSSRSSSTIDEPAIKCAGDGVCEEYRPCQLTCSEAEKAAKVVPEKDSENDSCGDSFWSACDYACMQSRIVSIPYTDGLCHETSRQTRQCHIGACARSDPCRVPFLVHAVLGFRGADVMKWSMQSEDDFVAALTKASSDLYPRKLFDEGDVNVLAVLPWYADDTGQSSSTSRGTSQEPDTQGIKIVLEIAIFNARAKGNSTWLTMHEKERDPAEGTLANIMRNITARFGTGDRKSICLNDDLFRLAKQALTLKKDVLKHEELVPKIVARLSQLDSHSHLQQYSSPFQGLFEEALYVTDSRLLSVWSIRTEIDEDINFYGPPRPWWFRVLALAHTVAFAFIAFMLLSTVWSVSTACCEAAKSETPSSPFRILTPRSPRHRYASLSPMDEDAEDAIMGSGSSNLELTVHSSGLKRYGGGTTPKKRRSTLFTQQSSDV